MAFNNQRVLVLNRLTSAAARKLGVPVVDAYAPSAAFFPNEVLGMDGWMDGWMGEGGSSLMSGQGDGPRHAHTPHSSTVRCESCHRYLT